MNESANGRSGAGAAKGSGMVDSDTQAGVRSESKRLGNFCTAIAVPMIVKIPEPMTRRCRAT